MTTNTNISDNSASQDIGINVACPYCSEQYPVSDLIENLVEQSLNYHVYRCLKCSEPVKIDPFEYTWLKNAIEKDALKNSVLIRSFKNNELTTAEKDAKKNRGILSRIRGLFK